MTRAVVRSLLRTDDDRRASAADGACAKTHRVAQALRSSLAAAMGLTVAFAPATALAGTTFTVNSSGDSVGGPGTLTLRQAITAANASDGNTVQFDPSLAGSTITLATGELLIDHAMTIVGPGVGKLAISGGNASRIFRLDCPAVGTRAVSISSLTLVNSVAILAYVLLFRKHH